MIQEPNALTYRIQSGIGCIRMLIVQVDLPRNVFVDRGAVGVDPVRSGEQDEGFVDCDGFGLGVDETGKAVFNRFVFA